MNKKTDNDWEDVTVRIKRKGKGHALSRKVVTGKPNEIVIVPELDEILEAMQNSPREFRLATSDGQEAIRLFPCLTSDLKEMVIVAQAMGDFRRGIPPQRTRFTYRGESISRKEVERMNRRAKEEQHVTPDVMATCPKCHFTFRVGKKLV